MLSIEQIRLGIKNYSAMLKNPKFKPTYGDQKTTVLLKTSRSLLEEYLQFRLLLLAKDELSKAAKLNRPPAKEVWDSFNAATEYLKSSHNDEHLAKIDAEVAHLTTDLQDSF